MKLYTYDKAGKPLDSSKVVLPDHIARQILMMLSKEMTK